MVAAVTDAFTAPKVLDCWLDVPLAYSAVSCGGASVSFNSVQTLVLTISFAMIEQFLKGRLFLVVGFLLKACKLTVKVAVEQLSEKAKCCIWQTFTAVCNSDELI
jgi:hypothetical protein